MKKKGQLFIEGIRDGLPIGAGYFAVSFSLGIVASEVGLTPIQGFIASLTVIASAGQYAGFAAIGAKVAVLTMAAVILVANARYLLMSCALSQRFDPKTTMLQRLGVGFFITDEIFGVTIARPGYIEPLYVYSVALGCVPLWALGTMLGIICGNILPIRAVSALSVALYAMFLAIIIPPAKKDRVVAILIVISFVVSYVCSVLPGISKLSEGMRIIILTIVIAAAASAVAPHKETDAEDGPASKKEGLKS